jgi:hypothetical protein
MTALIRSVGSALSFVKQSANCLFVGVHLICVPNLTNDSDKMIISMAHRLSSIVIGAFGDTT